jgi:hypothetical protein
MKRYFSFFLAIVMLFILTGTAIAEEKTPAFVISEATAAPGETVRVTVSIVNNPKVASVQLEPQYDHNVLEWTNIEQGDYADFTGTWYPRIDKGYFAWFGAGGQNVDFDGVLATLVFKVNENAPAGDTTVTVSYAEDNVYDEDEENVHFDIQDGKVTVKAQQEKPAFKTQSLLLAGQIGVRFYAYLPKIEGYVYQSVGFTISGRDGKAATVPFSADLPRNSRGWYGFTYYVSTVQMADTITATLNYTVNGAAKTLVKTYSVKAYFAAFDENYAKNPGTYTGDVVNLIKAAADLGHYVQAHLDETASDWSVQNGDHAAMNKVYTTYTDADLTKTTATVADHALKVEGSCSDIQTLSFRLELDHMTEIRVIVTAKDGFSGTFTATVDGKATNVTKGSENRYVIGIPDVPAHQLSRKHTIVISTANGTVTLTGSALSYVNMMLETSGGNPAERDAAIALCRYSGFADKQKDPGSGS